MHEMGNQNSQPLALMCRKTANLVELLRPSFGHVMNPKHFNVSASQAIGNDVIFVHNQFARSNHSARATNA